MPGVLGPGLRRDDSEEVLPRFAHMRPAARGERSGTASPSYAIRPHHEPPMPAMIQITDARKTFTMHLQGGVELPVVRGVSFRVQPGECVVLSGPSGAGKSSILKMIFGNYRCDGGRIEVLHQGQPVDLAGAAPRQ